MRNKKWIWQFSTVHKAQGKITHTNKTHTHTKMVVKIKIPAHYFCSVKGECLNRSMFLSAIKTLYLLKKIHLGRQSVKYCSFIGAGEKAQQFRNPGLIQWLVKKKIGWRDDSTVKNICHSCRGPGFSPQHPHGILQLLVSPIAGGWLPSSVLCRLLHKMVHVYILRDTLIHTKINKSKKNCFKILLLQGLSESSLSSSGQPFRLLMQQARHLHSDKLSKWALCLPKPESHLA